MLPNEAPLKAGDVTFVITICVIFASAGLPRSNSKAPSEIEKIDRATGLLDFRGIRFSLPKFAILRVRKKQQSYGGSLTDLRPMRAGDSCVKPQRVRAACFTPAAPLALHGTAGAPRLDLDPGSKIQALRCSYRR
jgi:hypothetical protein